MWPRNQSRKPFPHCCVFSYHSFCNTGQSIGQSIGRTYTHTTCNQIYNLTALRIVIHLAFKKAQTYPFPCAIMYANFILLFAVLFSSCANYVQMFCPDKFRTWHICVNLMNVHHFSLKINVKSWSLNIHT